MKPPAREPESDPRASRWERFGLPSGLRRRGFLAGALALAAGCADGSLRWWRGAPAAPGAPAAAPVVTGWTPVPAPQLPVFWAVADVIVPRWQGHPAASEIDLLPRLEKLARMFPEPAAYRYQTWLQFEAVLRRRVDFSAGLPDPGQLHELFESLYTEWRRADRPSAESHYFEKLRMDVLRAYYSSPAGWKAVGYAGPVRRSHPREAEGEARSA